MTQPIAVRTDPPKPEDIRAQYGFVALIAEQIPEIGTLMEQAVKENWTSDRFSLALAATNWWKSTPDPIRQWTVKNIADPASAANEMRAGAQSIYNTMVQLGIPTDIGIPGQATTDDRLGQLWLQSKLQGLDEAGTRSFLFREVASKRSNVQNPGGRYGQLINGMYQTASDYGYTSSGLENEVYSAANEIMMGGAQAEPEAWKSKMINYAVSKYAPFADRLRGGETVMDIARPYMESYAQTLELNPQDIGLSDKTLQKAMQGNGRDAMAVWQFEQELRKDTRYGFTRGARNATAQTLEAIGKAFGMVG